jgi:hypothetical protein
MLPMRQAALEGISMRGMVLWGALTIAGAVSLLLLFVFAYLLAIGPFIYQLY